MVGSGARAQIDAYDTVIRLNRMPSASVASDFGTKTDVFFMNHPASRFEAVEMLQREGMKPRRTSCRDMDNCKAAAILQRGDNHCSPQKMASQYWGWDHSMIGCVRPNVSLTAYGFKHLEGFQPSTGFQAFLALLPLCQELDLFGFGGNATADDHFEWSGHNRLHKEHRIQDAVAAREWSRLEWSEHADRLRDAVAAKAWGAAGARGDDPWPWMQARAARVRKFR